MFRAIVSGKAGRLPAALTPGSPWAVVFKQSEDLLTATVFERLSYLDGSLLWAILRGTFGPALPPYKIAELINIEFWPRWDDTVRHGTVEPDILLQFDVGDPARRVDLIIEAKLGGVQYAEQWHRQWSSYQAYMRKEESDAPAALVLLLAIGGLIGGSASTVERLTQEVRARSGDATELVASAAEWSRLASVLNDLPVENPSAGRVIEDITEALALFGYRHLRALDSLSAVRRPKDPVAAMTVVRQLGR